MVIKRKVPNDKQTQETNQVPQARKKRQVTGTGKVNDSGNSEAITIEPEGYMPRRFYRSNLSTIVWDSENGKPLADFSQGHFTTNNPRVVQILIDKGYVEIPLNSQEPPSIIINQPSTVLKQDHVPVLPPGLSQTQAQNRISAVSQEI